MHFLHFLGISLPGVLASRLFSSPVLTGYPAGSGVIIIAGQLAKITGIKVDAHECLTKTEPCSATWPRSTGGRSVAPSS
jgi:MFS superfamily sulfate permease-like transporter